MTDTTLPPDANDPDGERTPDELACGYLDGELDPAARARVEADSALMARVDELRAVSAAVATPVAALADDHRETMLAAALGAATTAGTGPVTESDEATVVPIERARAQRSGRALRLVAGGLAAAAAVGVVALALNRPGSSEDNAGGASADTVALEAATAGGGADRADAEAADTTAAAATAAADAPATEAPASAAPAGSEAPAEDASSGSAGAPLVELGPLANRSEAIDAAKAFSSDFAATGAGPCPDYPPPFATATFQGVPAYLVLIEAAPDGNRFALVDQATCAVLVKVDTAGR